MSYPEQVCIPEVVTQRVSFISQYILIHTEITSRNTQTIDLRVIFSDISPERPCKVFRLDNIGFETELDTSVQQIPRIIINARETGRRRQYSGNE